MTTKETPPDTQEANQDTSDEPQKKDDILWMLSDRSWAEHLITDKNLIN